MQQETQLHQTSCHEPVTRCGPVPACRGIFALLYLIEYLFDRSGGRAQQLIPFDRHPRAGTPITVQRIPLHILSGNPRASRYESRLREGYLEP